MLISQRFLTDSIAFSLSSDQLSPSLAYIGYIFQTSGEYLSLINFNAKFKPLDIYVPPDSALWKNSYSLTCFATVV